jgi:flagellar biosynthetic protein FliQ
VDMSHAIVWSREALRMSLLLGGPLLAAAFLVGLLVNIGQTLTQLHEPVVGLVPRIAAVTVVLL